MRYKFACVLRNKKRIKIKGVFILELCNWHVAVGAQRNDVYLLQFIGSFFQGSKQYFGCCCTSVNKNFIIAFDNLNGFFGCCIFFQLTLGCKRWWNDDRWLK